MTTVYQEYRPSAHLADHVECFWSLDASGDVWQSVAPDGCMDILLRFDRGVYAVDAIGSMTRTENTLIRAGHAYLGARFKPGRLRQFARIDCAAIVNGMQAVGEGLIADHGGWIKRMEHAVSVQERIALFESALSIKCDELSGQRAIDALVAAHGRLGLDELADIAQLSERQLRRQCIAATGLSPKALARVLRFCRARAAMQAGGAAGLADIALDCGYADQSHFSNEFAAFAGAPPKAFLQRRA